MKKNKIACHVFMIIWTCVNVLVFYGNFKGRVRFGLGLGDLSISIPLIIFVLIILIIYLRNNLQRLNKVYNTKIIITCIVELLFVFLKMTYLRGPVSPWDGNIFF
ncbi:hypothetical protein [Marinifilum caeruleilacunae]|uniref:Uncharacterized protein n=1 Tax=Marinifilum caeruleilacunae TaxID=2499076 RepID=A0ABX1X090_9BACT|nr:hypothetical protein [Marinifilum caeruleilacunae]NOU61490.1 hypothetical protein [Marinifilum caeruleilacunae]